jgi:polyketide biosynthesis enoyl-CoA hydratase PksI
MDGIAVDGVSEKIIADGVAVLQMCAPASQNRLTGKLIGALIRALKRAGSDPRLRVLIVRGLADTFCGGASLEVLEAVAGGAVPLSELDLPRCFLECPLPIIAAMEGAAVGGGFTLGLGADLIMLAAESRYGFNFTELGISPGMGTTFLAREALGRAVGDELMYSAEFRRGRDLKGAPGINAVLPREQLFPRAVDVGARIAEKPRAVLAMLKQCLAKERLAGFLNARAAECRMHERCLYLPETLARIRSEYAN